MIQYLIKTTEEIVVDTEYDVDDLQKFLKRDAEEQNYVIQSFSYQEKANKAEESTYFKCKVVKLFNPEKSPDLPLRKVVYTTFEPELRQLNEEDADGND